MVFCVKQGTRSQGHFILAGSGTLFQWCGTGALASRSDRDEWPDEENYHGEGKIK